MYRRVVSLLLLPCVLLTQSAAAFGHAHGGGQPGGHHLRPHVHTGPVAPERHDHTDHHGHGGHHHHHDHGDDAPELTSQPTTPTEPLPDHDSDAVYIAAVEAVVSGRPVLGDEPGATYSWAIPCPRPFDVFSAITVTGLSSSPHPPPCCSCPLYVRHLTLLI